MNTKLQRPTSFRRIGMFNRLLLLVGIIAQLPPAVAAIRTWDGGGANNNWTTAANWVGEVAPVAGDDLVFPSAAVRPSNVNNFPAGTAFNSIALTGLGYFLSGSNIVLAAGLSATHDGGENTVLIPLQLSASQTFTNTGPGSLTFFTQSIDLNGNNLTIGVGGGEVQIALSSILGAGDFIKTGAGTLVFGGGTSTYTGATEARQGTFIAQGAAGLGTAAGNTTVFPGAALDCSGTFLSAEPMVLGGTLRLGGETGTNTWTGSILLNGTNATFDVNLGNARALVNGVISGSGGLTKGGQGTLILNATNTYTGTTTNLAFGTLLINGYQPQSPIRLNGGTLGGTGVVGTITAGGTAGGRTLSPGGSPGILTCSDLTLVTPPPATTIVIELNGTTPGSGYDQVNVNGTVALSNVLLSVTLGFTPAGGDSFVIINNDGSDPVTGGFNGAPEGAILNIAGKAFRISYIGGDGNDIVLTRISPPTRFTAITRLGDGNIFLQATGGLNGFSYTIEAATNLNPVILWSNLSPSVVNGSGQFSFTDTNALLFPKRFYRVLNP